MLLKLKIIMKVCIIGSGLISFTLAKILINRGIYVDIFSKNNKIKIDKARTLSISKSNIEFFNKEILNIEKFLWKISQIEIYSDNSKNDEILNFKKNSKYYFGMIKNIDLINFLISSLDKSKLVNFKRNLINYNLIKKNYKLIINCEFNNLFSKKFFFRKNEKDYNSHAYTSIIDHKKIKNDIARQIFTKDGPLAFLPISEKNTSIVYSARGNKKIDLRNIIKKYNPKYSILKINKISFFKLKSFSLRNYYHDNVLAFGDLLHKLHPLAGQGFNMSLRDIKVLVQLIKNKIDYGLDIDSSICIDFEKKIKHTNYLFSSGIDFIYEFFNFESKMKNKIFTKSLKILGKNKNVNKFFTKFADKGISI